MMGNRWRRLAMVVTALLGIVMVATGTVVVIEAAAHLAGFDPVLLGWRRFADRLSNLRIGGRWVGASGVALCAGGLLLLGLSAARRHRRTIVLSGASNNHTSSERAVVDRVDARRALTAAAESVPAVGSARTRWSRRGRVTVTLRSTAGASAEATDVARQRVDEALGRLGIQPAGGLTVRQSRRKL